MMKTFSGKHAPFHFFLIFFIFWFSGSFCSSQKDSTAFGLFEKARKLMRNQEYDSALHYFGESSVLYRISGPQLKFFESLVEATYVLTYQNRLDSAVSLADYMIANCGVLEVDSSKILLDAYSLKARILCTYSDNEKAIGNMLKALDLSRHYYGEDHIRTASVHGNTGIIYSAMENYPMAINHCSKAADIARKNYGEFHAYVASSYNTIGNIYSEIGMLDSARIMHEKALTIRLKILGKNHLHTAASYSNLGVVYYMSGDYQKALQYEKSVFAVRKEILGDMHPEVAKCYNNLGSLFEVTGRHDLALQNHLRSLSIREAVLPPDHPDIAMSYMNLANTYNHFGEYDKAIEYHNRSLEMKKKLYGEFHPEIATVINNIGHCYFLKNDFIQAGVNFHASLDNRHFQHETYYRYKKLAYENNLTDCLIELNLPDSALYHVNHTIQLNIIGIQNQDTIFNDRMEYLRSLALQARILALLAGRDHCAGMLKKSVDTYLKAADQIYIVRNEYDEEESMQVLAEKTSGIFDQALHATFRCFDITSDSSYLEKFFLLSEKSKNDILRQHISQKNALKSAGIPDPLQKRETGLRSSVREYKNKLLILESDGLVSDPEYERAISGLITSSREYKNLIDSLERDFPVYGRIKRSFDLPAYNEISACLNEKTLLLSYSLADTILFIQAFDSKSKKIIRTDLPPDFDEMVKTYLKGIKSFDTENFSERSNRLYKVLIAPVEGLMAGKEDLVIIPDKILFYFPFETLCSEKQKATNNFSTLPYLIKNYSVGYHYSVSMFADKKNNRIRDGKGFLGFAPVFGSDSTNGYVTQQNSGIFDTTGTGELALRAVSVNGRTFNELKNTETEIREIVHLFDLNKKPAKGYFHSMATEEIFRKISPEYRYLHISTHGIINDNYPELSGLIFSQPVEEYDTVFNFQLRRSPDTDGILYVSEIPALNLNADLVVLSACETGLGRMVNGEGILSMTRGFLYAGVPNIVFSLWKVSDRSTRELMVNFYSAFMQGEKYDRALQKAKLQMIRQEKYSYPLNWAGFSLVGGQQNLSDSSF